ncbi:396_t:CDS:2, partial [Acaulospora colombiana]
VTAGQSAKPQSWRTGLIDPASSGTSGFWEEGLKCSNSYPTAFTQVDALKGSSFVLTSTMIAVVESPTMVSVLLLGATGYIGREIASKLRDEFPGLRLAALIRNPIHTKALQVHLGDVNDMGGIVNLVARADIVINAAVSDNICLIQAILAGQRNRQAPGGKGILVHLSKSNSSGLIPFAFLQDQNLQDWMAQPPRKESNTHRIMEMADESSTLAFIIAPTMVFGGDGGRDGARSHHLYDLVQHSRRYRRVYFPGNGMNTSNAIHVNSLIDLCFRVIRLGTSPLANSLKENPQFFFAGGSEFSWAEAASRVADILYRKQMIDSARVVPGRADVLPDLWKYSRGGSVECVRGRSLGWAPKEKPSLLDSLDKELESILVDPSVLTFWFSKSTTKAIEVEALDMLISLRSIRNGRKQAVSRGSQSSIQRPFCPACAALYVFSRPVRRKASVSATDAF